MPRREVRRGLPSRRAVAARSTAENALSAIRGRVRLRRARSEDAAPLLALINAYAGRGLLLRRSEESLRRHLADFTVAVRGGELVGCGSLEALAAGLGEVRSLAVAEGHEGRGLGRRIVQHLLEEAGRRGFSRVLALTRRVSFFGGLGFEVTERERFLDKLAADCASCPMNACCDETAMVRAPLERRRHRDTERQSRNHTRQRPRERARTRPSRKRTGDGDVQVHEPVSTCRSRGTPGAKPVERTTTTSTRSQNVLRAKEQW